MYYIVNVKRRIITNKQFLNFAVNFILNTHEEYLFESNSINVRLLYYIILYIEKYIFNMVFNV